MFLFESSRTDEYSSVLIRMFVVTPSFQFTERVSVLDHPVTPTFGSVRPRSQESAFRRTPIFLSTFPNLMFLINYVLSLVLNFYSVVYIGTVFLP